MIYLDVVEGRNSAFDLGLVERVEYVGAVNHRSTSVHVDGHTQGFRYLFTGYAELLGFSSMEGNAAIAACRHGHCKGDELASLGVQMVGFPTGGAESGHAFHRFWRQAVELYQTSIDVFAGLLPILHGFLTGMALIA